MVSETLQTGQRRIILLNKPFNVLSQFTDAEGRATLRSYVHERGVYPCGRLDRDSEGLLVLTNDGALQHRLSHPEAKVSKSYWVQVEGVPDEPALQQLRTGLLLKDGMTLPTRCRLMSEPSGLWPRDPPIRERRHIPTSWLELVLREGRNRQVRRMCAAVGHPVLRLIRYRVASWTIDGLACGHSRVIEPAPS
ncbi:MAG: pseudouridine synthase [Pseudomonadales bacterium]